MHFTSWFLAEENDASIDVTLEGKEKKTVKLNKTKVLCVAVPVIALLATVAFINLVLVAAILGVLAIGVGILEVVLRTVAHFKSTSNETETDSSEATEEASPETPKEGVIPKEDLEEKVNALNKHFNGEGKGASPEDDIAPAGAV